MNKSVTILVNSCDKYEDAWNPFFRLLKIHWPECENYRIILNTETKVYNCGFLNVETICGGKNISWSKRLKNVLLKIDSESVLMLMEDFFLKSRLNDKAFMEIVNYMNNCGDIGYISVKYKPLRVTVDGEEPKGDLILRDLLSVNYRLPLISALWYREYLLKIIRTHETPWEFEVYAGRRSKKYKYKVFDINNNPDCCDSIYDYDIDWQYGIGITHGQWLPKNKEFFDKYGIEVDFDNLGINYQLYEDTVNPPPKPQKPITEQKLNLKERLYKKGKKFKNIKPELKRLIRKFRSLV